MTYCIYVLFGCERVRVGLQLRIFLSTILNSLVPENSTEILRPYEYLLAKMLEIVVQIEYFLHRNQGKCLFLDHT